MRPHPSSSPSGSVDFVLLLLINTIGLVLACWAALMFPGSGPTSAWLVLGASSALYLGSTLRMNDPLRWRMLVFGEVAGLVELLPDAWLAAILTGGLCMGLYTPLWEELAWYAGWWT